MKREAVWTYLDLERQIKTPSILKFVKEALLLARDDFFTLPASSSGHYHPKYTLGTGGLIRHTKAALILAEELFPLFAFTTQQEELILVAITLHDIEKPDKLHPIMVKLKLEPLRDGFPNIFSKVIPLIESHMGQWDLFGKLPIPKSKAQHFVHLCDYLASREKLTIDI